MLPSSTACSVGLGMYVGLSVPVIGYGWCAQTSKVLRPKCLVATMNAMGSGSGREEPGASFPRGPVTPQATCSPGTGPISGEIVTACTPAYTAVQMRAYWSALSMIHRPPTRMYCGVSQTGLFGSFQAVHIVTAGSGVAPLPYEGSCCHGGGA